MRRLWCWRVRQRGEERIRQRRRRMVWQEQIGQRQWRRRLIWQRQRQRSKEGIRQRRLWNLRRRIGMGGLDWAEETEEEVDKAKAKAKAKDHLGYFVGY